MRSLLIYCTVLYNQATQPCGMQTLEQEDLAGDAWGKRNELADCTTCETSAARSCSSSRSHTFAHTREACSCGKHITVIGRGLTNPNHASAANYCGVVRCGCSVRMCNISLPADVDVVSRVALAGWKAGLRSVGGGRDVEEENRHSRITVHQQARRVWSGVVSSVAALQRGHFASLVPWGLMQERSSDQIRSERMGSEGGCNRCC